MLEARPERYVFQWQHELGGTTVEVHFEEHPEGTVIRLREHGYPDTPAGWTGFLDCSTGWGEALTLLEFYVEHDVTTRHRRAGVLNTEPTGECGSVSNSVRC